MKYLSMTELTVGTIVDTPYGKGVIKDFRQDGFFVIEPQNWKLANDKSPTFFLQEQYVKKVAPPTKTMEQYISERIQKAVDLRNEGSVSFKSQDFETAKQKYIQSLYSVQGLGENLTNEHRAQVFEQTIMAANNAALTCIKLKLYAEVPSHANSCIQLIEAIEKRLDGQVWQCLLTNGMTIDKLMAYKKKGLYYLGKSELMRQEYEPAAGHLRLALALIPEDQRSSKEAVDIDDLITSANNGKAKQLSKEKAMWSKAFKKNTEEAKKEQELISSLASNVLNKPLIAASAASSSHTKIDIPGVIPSSKAKTKAAPTSWWSNANSNNVVFGTAVLAVVGIGALALLTIQRSKK